MAFGKKQHPPRRCRTHALFSYIPPLTNLPARALLHRRGGLSVSRLGRNHIFIHRTPHGARNKMAPSGKARAAGVSASSFFDLKAELAKQEEEARKNKSAGKSTLVGGVKRPDKVRE